MDVPQGRSARIEGQLAQISQIEREIWDRLGQIKSLYGEISRLAAQEGTAVDGPQPPGHLKGQENRRGQLQAAIMKILESGGPMAPAAVVAALPGAGYDVRSQPKVMYNTVFLALKKNKAIEHTKDQRYRLRGK